MDSAIPVLAIRPATEHDVPELARLFTALGHPATAEAIAERWREWAAAGNTALVAPRRDGALAGAATLHRMVVLHRPRPVGRITALVVDTPLRGQGVGRALVACQRVVSFVRLRRQTAGVEKEKKRSTGKARRITAASLPIQGMRSAVRQKWTM